jgi:hypothetical protein
MEVLGDMGNRLNADSGAILDCEVGNLKTSSVLIQKTNALQFRLTERDLEILGFLLDQKFASLEQIYFRHFDVRKSPQDAMPKGLHVTRQRLQILKRAGLITTERVFSESKSLYLLTNFGFQTFQSKRPLDAYAKPMTSVDYRNYEHDTKVNDCRIALERAGQVMKWISERRIRLEGFRSQFAYDELPEEIIPDGVFVSSKGNRIAFEIECSHREKRRFIQKREAYESVMRGSQPLFSNVIWVAVTDPIQTQLRDVIQGDKRFLLMPFSHYLAKLWPNGLVVKV